MKKFAFILIGFLFLSLNIQAEPGLNYQSDEKVCIVQSVIFEADFDIFAELVVAPGLEIRHKVFYLPVEIDLKGNLPVLICYQNMQHGPGLINLNYLIELKKGTKLKHFITDYDLLMCSNQSNSNIKAKAKNVNINKYTDIKFTIVSSIRSV